MPLPCRAPDFPECLRGTEAALLQDRGAGQDDSDHWQAARASAEPPGAPGCGPGWGEATRKWIWHKLQKARTRQGSQQGRHFSCHLEKFFLHVKPRKVRPTCSERSHQIGWGVPAVPEQSLKRSFQRVFQARSAGLLQAAGQMLGSWGVLSSKGGPGHSSGHPTIMTSKCRHTETCQEGASLRPITPKQLAGWSHRRSMTSAPDTESCVALGQSLSLSEPSRPVFSDGDSSVKIDFKISPETERYIIAMTGPIHQKDKTMIKGRDSPNV